MWTRREMALDGSLALLFMSHAKCSCAASYAPHSVGCHLADEDLIAILPAGADSERKYPRGEESIIPHSEDRNFDFSLAQTLALISQQFSVAPGFGYYDDAGAANAYATPAVRLNGPDGTVLMGRNLLRILRSSGEAPDACVAGVCAHEFGHIIQFKHGLFDKVQGTPKVPKRSELQADFFAGYFAGARKREQPSYPAAVVALSIYKLGDSDYTDPEHHGTRDERGAAVV
jgi:hypothetical protein